MPARQKATNNEIRRAYAEHGSVWKAAEALGMCGQSVHERLLKMGVTTNKDAWTGDQVKYLTENYQRFADDARLGDLADLLGRKKTNVCSKARKLGLTNKRRTVPERLKKPMSERAVERIKVNGHPRGFAGRAHSHDTKDRIAARSKAMWNSMSEDDRAAAVMKMMKGKVAKSGSLGQKRPHGSWKAGWREVDGRRCYFRSRWEANFARYLQWLKEQGEILEWEYEPETFWFEKIKRGVRSYLPDFLVTEKDESQRYYEVKGWMDQRSRTTIKRFRKYYPQHTLIVIGAKEYKQILKKVGRLVDGWEE